MTNTAKGWGNKPTNSTATTQLKEAVKKGNVKRFTFELDEALHQKFKIYATQNNITMGEVLNSYIHSLVKM